MFVALPRYSLVLIAALCVLFGTIKEASGQDGSLQCQDRWISGSYVTLTCEVSIASINSKCVKQRNSTVFFRDTAPQCTVGNDLYAVCDGNAKPASCWCEKNNTYYKFKYRFRADIFKDGGLWTCQKVCFENNGVDNPLVITPEPACNASIEENPCKVFKCGNGECFVDELDGSAKCDCPILYDGHDCGVFSYKAGWIIAFMVIFFLLGGLELVIWWFITWKERSKKINRDGGVLDTSEHIQEFCEGLQKEACATLHVEVCNNPLVPGPVVILKSRNIFTLCNAEKRIEDVITRMKIKMSMNSDKPVRDVPTLDTNTSK